MAIDTANKRRAVHGSTLGLVLPLPDSSIIAADRRHCAGIYRGDDSVTPVSRIFRAATITGPASSATIQGP